MISNATLDKLEFTKIRNHLSSFSITDTGKSFLLKLSPKSDLDTINKEGSIVNEAKNILINLSAPPIEYLPVLEETLSKSRIEGGLISAKRILDILKLTQVSRNLKHFFKSQPDNFPLLYESSSTLFSDKLFEHQIQKIINEQGEVKENASKQLSEIRRDIRNKKDELVKSINRIIKNLKDDDFVREEYLTLRDGRMVIPIKVEHKRHLRGFIHSESSTGQTVYIEPEETLELNNEIVSLSFAEKREIERLLKELTKLIGQYSSELKQSLEVIAYIDSVFARAKHSIELIGAFPEIIQTKKMSILDARHPLLLKKIGRKNTVPLNIDFDDSRVIIITGPNAGGKTVVLKTIGLLSVMLQSGIHIPVSPDSNFHIFNKILLDIGDEQSIEDDLSTFSSHLKNLKSILEEADDKSLVLLDEIGTGTDPAEGSALAATILKTLLAAGSIVLASTHHGSLKLFAYSINGMQNAAMQFDHDSLTPTYKFVLGIPGSSYAFEIAGRLGFDEKLLADAKNNIESDKHKLEEFLTEIELKSNSLNKKLAELEVENTRLNGLSNLYKNNIEKLEKEKKEILKKAKSDAEYFLKDINKKIEKVVKDIKEKGASKEIIKESKKEIERLKISAENIILPEVESIDEKYNFSVGSFASVKNSSTTGEIIDLNSEKNRATILVGTLKIQIKLSELVPVKNIKEKEIRNSFDYVKTTEASYRLDIRGDRAEEAEFKIIKFIDDAYQDNLGRVEILHGKGTGVLKKTVNQLLKKHDKVKSFYFAPLEQGGEGITIAEIA
ncbi:MAG TPA: endonuclease MutS2 [Ignavibacteriaceae bacterium]|nr:endonuclease MutS2 [Ignavibacteriaceae bacterium]